MPMISSILYFGALIGAIGFGAGTIAINYNIGRFFGITLSQWVSRTRLKTDEASAEKLLSVRKKLEVLAHDVLKHRLLGLASLSKESDPTALQIGAKPLSRNEELARQDEFLRLCGVKATDEERLWNHLAHSLLDIYSQTHRFVILPPFDPLFSSLVAMVRDLRTVLWTYIGKDTANLDLAKKFHHLNFEKCTETYPKVLALADACRMVIHPQTIITRAIEAVRVQVGRADISDKIRIYTIPDKRLLCPAPTQTLTMAIARLIDNSLEQSRQIGIDVLEETDDFTGDIALIFKVYDMSDHIPDSGEFGMGMRGVRQSLKSFEGGIQYRLEHRDEFRKAAVISVPVSEYTDCPVEKRTLSARVAGSCAIIFSLAGFIVCLLYVLGGPPVEFAGKGETLTEFSVTTGEPIEIPLCSGGRNVRVEIRDANAACVSDNCSFQSVLESLRACEESIADPACPGKLIWTPRFEDGIRQGKNYEISVHCISEGPPASEALQRVRLSVRRPNSRPRLHLAQFVDHTTENVRYLRNGRNLIHTNVDAKLSIHILATDADADILTYSLRLPDGSIQYSQNGTFDIEPTWSTFATFTAEIAVSDGIDASDPLILMLEADRLHPIALESMSTWTQSSPARQGCDGNSESRICYLTDSARQELTIRLKYDTLQHSLDPRIEFTSTDSMSTVIKSLPRDPRSGKSQTGDQWEIYTRAEEFLIGFLELTNIEATAEPGVYSYTFAITVTPGLPAATSLAMTMHVSERSQRMPDLNTLLILALRSSAMSKYRLTNQHLQLTEYDQNDDASGGAAQVWIYSTVPDTPKTAPTIGNIACQTPSFAAAFEKPTVQNLHNAWRADFKLRKGCIPGLHGNLAAKQRLCAANISYDGNFSADDVVWIILGDRSCQPTVENFSLISPRDELADNTFRYQFKIIDPEAALKPSEISLSNSTDHVFQFDSSNTDETAVSGTLTIHASCSDPDAVRSGFKPILMIQPDGRTAIQKTIQLPISCPPLVTTDGNTAYYEVNEGSRLTVPLRHNAAVRLSLNAPFGTIIDDNFVWTASCQYGRGPHTIEIQTSSADSFGRPLQFFVMVNQCQPRFSISIDDELINPEQPVRISKGHTRKVDIQSTEPLTGLKFIPETLSLMPPISISEQPGTDSYSFNIACTERDASEDLMIQILSDEDNTPQTSQPLHLRIECVE